MTTNYRRGADFERRVMRDLEKHGYTAIRAAGSHGEADLIAFGDDCVWFVQCKTDGRMGPEERRALAAICQKCGALGIKASKDKRRRIRYQFLMPDGNTWENTQP